MTVRAGAVVGPADTQLIVPKLGAVARTELREDASGLAWEELLVFAEIGRRSI